VNVTKYNATEMSKMPDLWLSGVIFQAPNTPNLVFGRGGGAYDAPPDPLVGSGGGHPLPIPFPPRRLWRLDLGAFGASVVRPPNTNSWLRL